ncbi:Vam6/Vps39-like protein [Trichinella sp. T9]|nr:Vam6/Vps39-like protein [Trichinella sp. T9]
MFEAYSVIPVAQKLPLTVDSLTSHKHCVLAGTKSGFLLRYSARKSLTTSHHDSANLAEYDFQVCKTFSKKPVVQLKSLPMKNLLLSLTDNLVQVHDLTQATFPVISVVPKSKNATFFTTCLYQAECNGTEHCFDEGGSILLVVVVRRRCQLYTLKGTEFVEFSVLPEVAFADTIRYVALLDSYMVAVVRDEYFHITLNGDKAGVTSGTVRSLFTINSASKNSEPMISVLWNRRIFAVKRGDETFFLHDDGSLALNDGYENIHWSEIPSFIEYDRVYLLASLSKSIEIRSVKPSMLIQVIDMTKLKLITWSFRGCLYALSNPASNQSDLYCLNGCENAKINLQYLIKEKKYELAVQVAESMINDRGIEREKRIRDVKNLYAFHLFTQRRFQEAFDIYSETRAEVLYVIGLFPDLLPEEIRKTITYPGNLPTDLPNSDMQAGISALTAYLSEIRTNIARNLDMQNKLKRGLATQVGDDAFKPTTNEEIKQMKNLLEIVDTTLLQCYLVNNDMLISSLLRLPDNSCNVVESENLLKKHHKYSELFLLYERKSMHRQALELLKEQADEGTLPDCLDRAVNYLQDLGMQHFDLILEYAKWISDKNADLCIKIFTEDSEAVRSLDRHRVLEFIQRECPEQAVTYLEHVIGNWHDDSEKLHCTLAKLYVKMVKGMYAIYNSEVPEVSNFHKVGRVRDCRPPNLVHYENTLLAFLKRSNFYNPEMLLVQLPFNEMHEARALIFEKLGRHEQVLAIYANMLGDFEKAEQYCHQYYQPGSTLFLTLFQYYACPPDNSILGIGYASVPAPPANVPLALRVLTEYCGFMDPRKALEALPTDIPMADLGEALQAVLVNILDNKFKASISKALNTAEHTRIEERRQAVQGIKIVVNYDSYCATCGKKIGNSAFVRFVDGTMAHYYCYRK